MPISSTKILGILRQVLRRCVIETLEKKHVSSDSQPEGQSGTHPQSASHATTWRGRLGYIILGFVSLVWLGLRSGPKPNRLAYPCQQAAAGTGLGFLAYLIALISSLRVYRYLRKRLIPGYIILSVIGLMLIVLLQATVFTPSAPVRASPVLPAWTSPDAISDVFAVTNVPTPTVSLEGGLIPSGLSPAEALHDSGIDALLNLMSTHGTYFYKTAAQPQGTIGPNDVVVIKVNNQWNAAEDPAYRRAHTNIDALKGLLWRITQHPAGFTGAVIVVDNGQGLAVFDNADDNNAEDPRQSYQDVVDAFTGQGYNACISVWDNISNSFVAEYSTGDSSSGYVLVHDGSPGVDQLSYPKFEISCGSQAHQISMRYGLWNGTSYDNTRLKLINFPVLKRHSSAGATISVKNFMGFVSLADKTRRYGSRDQMHDYFMLREYGMLGRQLGLIRQADLNIVDGIWVSLNQAGVGPARDDVLLASTDPFAVDYYASAYVLVPHFTPDSDRANNADARYHGGDFRTLQMTNENQARLEGLTEIIDLDDSFTVTEEEAQFNVFVADATMPPPVSLYLSSQPASRTIHAGETTEYTLWLTGSEDVGPVTLSGQGVPAEASLAFEPNPVVPSASSTLTLTTTPAIAAGIYPITVTGVSTIATDTTMISLTIAAEPPPVTLTLSSQPISRTIHAGETTEYTLWLTDSGDVGPVTLLGQGMPAEASLAFEPNPVSPPASSTLTLTTTPAIATGIYPITVTGASTVATATTIISLTIAAEPPPITLTLSSQPSSRIIQVGKIATYTLWLTDSGDVGPVMLSVQGMPTEASLAFEPNPVALPASSTLTLTTTPAIATGIYTMTVTGASTVATDTTMINLIVTTEVASLTLSVTPTSRSIAPGRVATYTVVVNKADDFGEAINLATLGLPDGIDVTWSNNPIMPNDFSILSLVVTDTLPAGHYGFSVIATSGTQIEGEDLSLFIQEPGQQGPPFWIYLPIILKVYYPSAWMQLIEIK